MCYTVSIDKQRLYFLHVHAQAIQEEYRRGSEPLVTLPFSGYLTFQTTWVFMTWLLCMWHLLENTHTTPTHTHTHTYTHPHTHTYTHTHPHPHTPTHIPPTHTHTHTHIQYESLSITKYWGFLEWLRNDQLHKNCVVGLTSHLITYLVRIFIGSRDSIAGIASCYGLAVSGIESRWGRDFFVPSEPA